jgi:helicase C-terminal domain protein
LTTAGGGRSPLIIKDLNRYHVKTDKVSGIVNDPNDFLRGQGHPDAVVDLIKRLVTVSMRTQELVASLPKLEIPANA